jgi:hypothetical protein
VVRDFVPPGRKRKETVLKQKNSLLASSILHLSLLDLRDLMVSL